MKIRTPDDLRHWLRTARTLNEALPYLRRHSGKTFVVKYGGHAMINDKLSEGFARDVVLLKQIGIHPVIVHGGGPQIEKMLERLQIQSQFIDGLRVTDAATMEVVEMVLSGTLNHSIVQAINRAGGRAIGLSGKDSQLITARKMLSHKGDLGFVGEPLAVNVEPILKLQEAGFIPVIAPIGGDSAGQTYNINADSAAGAVAAALKASRLFMLTDVTGVLDEAGELIESLSAGEAERLIANGTVRGGMIPKIRTCLDAVTTGVAASVILDGRVPHALLLEAFTAHGAGTLIGAADNESEKE